MVKNKYVGKIPVILLMVALFLNIISIYVFKRTITNGLITVRASIPNTILFVLGHEQEFTSAYLIKLFIESLIIIDVGLLIILFIQEWLNTSMFSKFVIAYIVMDLTALQFGVTYRIYSLYQDFVSNFSYIRLGGAGAYLPVVINGDSIIILLVPLLLTIIVYVLYGYEWVVRSEDKEKEKESDYEIYVYAVIIIGLLIFIPFSQLVLEFPNVNYPGYTLRNTGDSVIISKRILGANLTKLNICSDSLFGVNLTVLREYYVISPSRESIENAQLYGRPLSINVTIAGKLLYNNYEGIFIFSTKLKVPTPRPVFNVSFMNDTLIVKIENYPCYGVRSVEITTYLDPETPLNNTVYTDVCPFLLYRTNASLIALNITYQYLGNFSSYSFYVEEGMIKTIEVQP